MRGKYFFMDFVKGWIKVLDPDHPDQVETFANGLTRPVDLKFAPDGSLYVLQRDAWVIDANFRPGTGSLLQIRAQPESATVRVSDVTVYGDMDCFRVQTPTATYVYGKRGAGFASIIDKDGHDWVAYRPDGQSCGEYRGLPKCGQPTKFFHCGYGYGQYKNDNPFTSRVTAQEAGHVRIESETRDGKSACLWDFYPDHATLTLLPRRLPLYWFIYEGTPGGRLDAKEDFVIRPDGTKTSLDQPWSQVVPWVCFGLAESPRRPVPDQPSSSRARRDRLLRFLAICARKRRIIPGDDRLRIRPQGIQRASATHPRPQAPCPRGSASASSTRPTLIRPARFKGNAHEEAVIRAQLESSEYTQHIPWVPKAQEAWGRCGPRLQESPGLLLPMGASCR